MVKTIELELPAEVLLSLHLSAEKFREEIQTLAAVSLFRAGRLSSGLAARWLGIPRTQFLLMAMQAGAELLENSQDDFERERALL